MSQLVFDLETIRDPDLSWEPKDPEQFPPPVHHRITALGYMWLTDDWNPVRIGVMGPDECDALKRFVAGIAKDRPRLIGFNSRRFDVPVLVARCFRHGMPTGWAQRYGNRYKPEQHLDVADWLMNYGAAQATKLDTWAHAMGLPGKRGVDGSDVAGLVASGEWERVADYCVEDVITTALVAARATLPPKEYDIVATSILRCAGECPHTMTWRAEVNDARVLLTTTGQAPVEMGMGA